MSTLCLDIGSTWTKAALISETGRLAGNAQQPTVLSDLDSCVRAVAEQLGATDAELLACSSAGGGLRLAVVGHERLISAEAGYRVALSAGAKVVHVASGALDDAGIHALRESRPDVLLLAGGTDGGDEKVLLHNAGRIATARLGAPIVLAGNSAARQEALGTLRATERTVVACENVLPDVGELAPGSARRAIREMFLRHVIGGMGGSAGSLFRRAVRAVTPDAVLTGVSRLARVRAEVDAGAVLVVDVGGATTDVYSASSGADDEAVGSVGLPPDRRTVEGDIGMRWSAPGLVAEADAERLLAPDESLSRAAEQRARQVDGVFADGADIRFAELATVLAVRRHLGLVAGRLGPHGVGLLVLSGGAFRHATADQLDAVRAALRRDPVLRPLLREARIVVDGGYVLAPVGLLADAGRTELADRLLTALSGPG